MTKQRRSFTPEFKREAAGLVLDQGYSHIEAARSLGLVESALRRWVKQLQEERQGVTPEEQRIDSRTAENPGAGRQGQPTGTGESDPKKATVLLMSDEFNRTR